MADALERARTVIEAARAARDRSAEIVLHRQLARARRPPVDLEPATEELLRHRLTH
ncbi:hypothetical protein ACFPK1_12350 [Actinomycetospora rhizophila]|uniref:Uncharacterized protein n=1 Tax=Actinomycetospora rhizophila TaxID=1416876 RepID=A0ABV9ZE37_9PSEU